MGLQVIQNSEGKATGIFIPINEWKRLKKQYQELESLEFEGSAKEQLLQELKEAVRELSLIEQGN